MFKPHFVFKRIKKMYNFIQPKHAPFYESPCSSYELDEESNYTKLTKSLNFEGKGCKGFIF